MNDQSLTITRKLQVGNILAGRFKLLEKIGSGSFGFVYKTHNLKNGELVATKFEVREDKSSKKISLLYREIKVLIELKGCEGFPQIIFYGKDESYHFLMETYLGSNLEELLSKCGGKFTQQTVLQIAIQILKRIEKFHSKNFIHRDMKPENLVIGRSDSSVVHLIDFGLAKYYRDTQGKHIPFITDKGMIGTARYASINSMQGCEQSRKDDLEAIGYVLLYFLEGKLPWMNIVVQNQEDKYKKVLERKQNLSVSLLCQNAPKCFQEYFEIVRKLNFEEDPDYSKLRKLFEDELEGQAKSLDWLHLEEYRGADEISIDCKLEQAASSVENEGNIQKQLNNMKMQESKILNPDKAQQKQLFLDIPKKGYDNQLLNVSIDSSKLNHYQMSQQKLTQTGLMMFPSSKQFDDVKIPTTQEFGGFSYKLIESRSKILFQNENQFDDIEVADDDKPDLQLKSINILKKGRTKIFR